MKFQYVISIFFLVIMLHASAQFNLGVMYANIHGASQVYGRAVEWHMKAVNQGHASVRYELDVMLEDTDGVSQDNQIALNWRGACALRLDGYDNHQDNTRAVEWYSGAANQENALDALSSWSDMWLDGGVFLQENIGAEEWYIEAANQESTLCARYCSAGIWSDGGGFFQENIRAEDWSSEAAKERYSEAAKERYSVFLQENIRAEDWSSEAAKKEYSSFGYGIDCPSEVQRQVEEWYITAANQESASTGNIHNVSSIYDIDLLHVNYSAPCE